MFYNFLFPKHFRGTGVSFLLLALRVFFGILFLTHGLDKLMNFNTLSNTYPSVLGLGGYTTLMITIFADMRMYQTDKNKEFGSAGSVSFCLF